MTFAELTEIIAQRTLPLQWQWRVIFYVWELMYSHTDHAENVLYRRTLQKYGAVWRVNGEQMYDEEKEWELIQFRFEREIRRAFIELYQNAIGTAFSEVQVFIEMDPKQTTQ